MTQALSPALFRMRRAVVALLLVSPLPLVLQEDPARAIKSKDVDERLRAVEQLTAEEHPKAEKLLEGALKDDDWEVVENAARGLATRGTNGSVKALVKTALEGPTRRARRVAADSLAALDAEAALKELAKKVSGRDGLAACRAIATVGANAELTKSPKALTKLLKSKEREVAVAAAAARIATAGDERAEVLTELLEHERLTVRAEALRGVERSPRAGELPILLELLRRDSLNDVIERRAGAAVRAIVRATPPTERKALLGDLLSAETWTASPTVLARQARLVGRLGEWSSAGAAGADADAGGADAPPWPGTSLLDPEDVAAALRTALGAGEASTRAAGAKALELLGTEPALDELRKIAKDDDSPRVRWIALNGLMKRSSPRGDANRALVLGLLADDPDYTVRERAAVALGVQGLDGVTKALNDAAADPDWRVAVAALVSLGKTRADEAPRLLAGHAKDAADWRLRGAAAYGLIHTKSTDGLPPLIACLDDERLEVRATAHHHLKAVSRLQHPAEREPWEAWWKENGGKVRLVDPKEEEELRQKYGYARRPASEIYAGLDLVVLVSRGDHIQNLLAAEGIGHRLTEAAKVPETGLHPSAIFVANCTGEIEPADLESLEWFVHAGGYLFGSCWALTETIQRIQPGVLRRFETASEVLDNVTAEVCRPDSPYIEDVFPPDVVPIYALQGAHLIEVLDRERAELLVDSPACAEKWGCGNLAAWFEVGHGKILDSANHFDVQGLELATHLRKPEERQAYAADHMGIGYDVLRETRDEKFWDSGLKASQEIRDLSVFRLVTNFVRLRRLAGL